MLKQAKGFDRADEEPQNFAPASDTQPTPNTTGARLRSAATSIAGIWKRHAAAAAHVIFRFCLLCFSSVTLFLLPYWLIIRFLLLLWRHIFGIFDMGYTS